MARNNIDIGALGNPATGDTLRTAMIKINNNFEELYIGNAADGQLTTSVTNGDISIQPNGTGTVEIDALSVNSDNITSLTTNSSVTITGNGTAGVDIEGISVNGTTITSSDSSTININENLIVDGTGDFSGTLSVTGASTLTAGATIDGISITDNTITTSASNANLELTASGTGSVSIDGIQISGTEISSSDSTQITIKENLHVTGNITGTIDADNSTVSNLEVDNFKASAIITVAESLASNDSDTALVTAGAVIDYVDAQDANIASDTLTFTNKTIDANATGNNISNIDIGNMTAAVVVTESEGIGSNDNDTTIPTSAAVKDYVDNNAGGGSTGDITFTGSTISAPSNADLTLNAGGTGSVDIDGIQIKGTSISSTDSTQININENVSIDGTLTVGGASLSGTLNTAGNTGTGSVALASQSLQVTGTTNEINIEAAAFALTASLADNISGIVSVTASSFLANDAIKIIDNKITGTRSNENVELEANGTGGVIAQSPFTFNAGYIEKINTLTSSSTITVNCATASVHKVTLATSTQFNIANLPTGGTVTLIITQDGTGSRTATFGTDGSSAVKFPSNSSTLSTGAADIDVVTIINDGTNFLGNIAKDYRSS